MFFEGNKKKIEDKELEVQQRDWVMSIKDNLMPLVAVCFVAALIAMSTVYAPGESRAAVQTANKAITIEDEPLPAAMNMADAKMAQVEVKCWLDISQMQYHLVNYCGTTDAETAIQVTVEEAEAAGYTRCPICW